ncbi:Lysophospholipase L1 [Methylobacterium sp. ap11]|jgi:lysophospholipase L1-like esterase|nr:Lysophospholipase L1 [Methylobacterium sp. ap11]
MARFRPGPRLLTVLALALALTPGGGALAASRCPAIPPRAPMPVEATPTAVPIPDWRQRADQLTRQATARDLSATRVVLIGDSITQGWEPTMWELFWGSYAPLNLGLWGDLTQGVLWRLHNGQWPSSLKPDVAVVLIGTNNAGWRSKPEDTALGVAEIVRFIEARSPATKVLLLGILPRGADASAPERPTNAQVTALIRQCADGKTVFFANPGRTMVDGAGRISTNVMFDYLHPTMVGYAILGGAIAEEVRRLAGR